MVENGESSDSFTRAAQVERLAAGEPFDLLVIGGGATGAGVALDAASRGYRVALCEQSDFGKGASSRSTKLVHGGVRYLQQGNVHLVRDALRERELLLRNAPHLVYPLPTIVPCYRWWEPAYYRAGLAAYDLLAGRMSLGRSRLLGRAATLERLPTLNDQHLRGGVRYFDAGFDDSRLLIDILKTAVSHGATCVNYARVEGLLKEQGRVVGAEIADLESGSAHAVRAKVVVNAAGPYGDAVRRLANAGADDALQPSQGAHITLPRKFLPTDTALIVPKTSDGRVIFAIPWQNHTLVGTTDTRINEPLLEPRPLKQEVQFLLETVSQYLDRAVSESDVLSMFAGLRPLVRQGGSQKTSKLSRDHAVRIDDSDLVSISGGKWTTYRKMAEDCVDQCVEVADLDPASCRTANMSLGCANGEIAGESRLRHYGQHAAALDALLSSSPDLSQLLDSQLPHTVGEAVWAIRCEMARTVEDVLSRRLRMLVLNSQAALRAAPRVAKLLAAELGHDAEWVEEEIDRFNTLARGYAVEGAAIAGE